MLVPLEDATVDVAGGKAGTLGRLLRAGLPVPAGVVVPLAVYRAAAQRLDVPGLARRGGPRAAQEALEAVDLPRALVDELARALLRLGDGPVAVRSSATGEDGATRSAAGQHLSRLGVRGVDEVVDAVRACWASLWSPEAVAYRRLDDAHDADGPRVAHATARSGGARETADFQGARDADASLGAPGVAGSRDTPATAVLVQRHVDADVAGVLFTGRTPGDPVVVEASWGLGESVVGGIVTPDRHVVGAGGAVDTLVGAKVARVDRAGVGVVRTAVPDGLAGARCLDDAAVRGLAGLGRELAALLGGPQDVEWALAGGVFHLLQARPVTAALPGAPGRGADASAGDGSVGVAPAVGGPAPARDERDAGAGDVLVGVPGSRGLRRGPVRVVAGPGDFAAVQPGDVLVCRFTDPAWTRLFGVVAAVVTQAGGVLSHAAVVAREHGIPAVLAVPAALVALRDGELVEVDGSAGTVRRVR
ncbi:PEP/pyruvate-binding domain-containing protein [Cellulomonas cellasea]|uniref:Pyruvate,water dikinase n=1 Tax=Cellulomonas cellasea TaxID=43670 RepID=A0A7W4UEJ4_9CELL|nr:PEP/pyruvate-binding domain-containing protein [Cellulomonas cellasea]MBB2922737.1 pyruvate,water dikinase [Cellulomonas cellasea]